MLIKLEIDTNDLKKLVIEHLSSKLSVTLTEKDVNIQVKASMNYKSEWENGLFKAVVNKIV